MAGRDRDKASTRISQVREWKRDVLPLSGLDIDTIPAEIVSARTVLSLALNGTQITDLGPLSEMTWLRSLDLEGLPVTDLAPLTRLAELDSLDLKGTRVTDIGPLASLTSLRVLDLAAVEVEDLTPLVALNNLQQVTLIGAPVRDLAPLAGLGALEHLALNGTRVDDLRPLASLFRLRDLYLNGTGVADLAPLSNLSALRGLYLKGTGVADISPLLSLPVLRDINLDGSQVADLRPFLSMAALDPHSSAASPPRLNFADTPACADPVIAAAAAIGDDKQRLLTLFSHLRTQEQSEPPATAAGQPHIPDQGPAPLRVERDAGTLRIAAPGEGSDMPVGTAEAWQALRDVLDDMVELRAGIHNSMRPLARALARVEAAMGADPAETSAIALGLHGSRVIALAPLARDALMDEAATEVAAFAALLTLHLEHFPAWRAYRDGAAPAQPEVEAALPALGDLVDALERSDAADPGLTDALGALVEAVEDAPSDPLARKGLVDTARNLAIALVAWVRTEAVALTGGSWAETKKAVTKAVGGASLLGLLSLLETSTGALAALSVKMPAAFGWLRPVLTFLGL